MMSERSHHCMAMAIDIATYRMDSLIVLDGQVEPHYTIEIINYPRFQLASEELKALCEQLSVHLMDEFDQNRLVLNYSDQPLMLEKDEKVLQEMFQQMVKEQANTYGNLLSTKS